MHALRLGSDIPSAPIGEIPLTVDVESRRLARSAFKRGFEYFQIFDAFMMYHKRVIPLVSVTANRIEFGSNAHWKALDLLDLRLSEDRSSRPDRPALTKRMQPLVDRALGRDVTGGAWNGSAILHKDDLRDLVPIVRDMLLPAYRLPDEWRLDDVHIGMLRRCWEGMAILATIHQKQVSQLYPRGRPHFGRLMIWPRDRWVKQLQVCAQLGEQEADTILALHTYDRGHQPPDIVLTPFLPLGADLLATDPWLILSSSLERNFCAHVAREYKDAYDAQSNLLASAMASDLSQAFGAAGYQVESAIPVSTDLGDTDIDLLVWSPDERYVLTAELKWVIATADFVEVVNRGEEAAKRAICDQLPKHSAALERDAAGLVARAFSLGEPPRIDAWSSMLIMRGYVGSPRLPTERFCFAAEELLRERLNSGRTLQGLTDWCKVMDYLPREGQDFQMRKVELRSPSGVIITTYGCAARV